MIRPFLCAVGLHRWQYLLAPPTWKRGDAYDPGVWCIFCGKRGPRGPGDGALVPRSPRAPSSNGARALAEVSCG